MLKNIFKKRFWKIPMKIMKFCVNFWRNFKMKEFFAHFYPLTPTWSSRSSPNFLNLLPQRGATFRDPEIWGPFVISWLKRNLKKQFYFWKFYKKISYKIVYAHSNLPIQKKVMTKTLWIWNSVFLIWHNFFCNEPIRMGIT